MLATLEKILTLLDNFKTDKQKDSLRRYIKANNTENTGLTEEEVDIVLELGFKGKNITSINNRINGGACYVAKTIASHRKDIEKLALIGLKPKNVSSMLGGLGGKSVDVVLSQLTSSKSWDCIVALLSSPKIPVMVNGVCMNGLGLKPDNLSSMLNGAGKHINVVLNQLVSPKSWDCIVALLSPPDRKITVNGKQMDGLGFTSDNLSSILSKAGKNVSDALVQLTSSKSWDCIVALLSPPDRKVTVNGKQMDGLGFTSDNLSSILSGAGKNVSDALAQLTSSESLDCIVALLSPPDRKVTVNGKQMYGLGFLPGNLSSILNGAGKNVSGALAQLTSSESLDCIVALLSPPDRKVTVNGKQIDGLGFTPSNLSSILNGAGKNVSGALAQLTSSESLDCIVALLSPPDRKVTVNGKQIDGLGFTANNLSSMLHMSGKDIGNALAQLTSSESLDCIVALLSPPDRKVTVNGKQMDGLGFTANNLSSMLHGAGKDIGNVLAQLTHPQTWHNIVALLSPSNRKVMMNNVLMNGLGLAPSNLSSILHGVGKDIGNALVQLTYPQTLYNIIVLSSPPDIQYVMDSVDCSNGLGLTLDNLSSILHGTGKDIGNASSILFDRIDKIRYCIDRGLHIDDLVASLKNSGANIGKRVDKLYDAILLRGVVNNLLSSSNQVNPSQVIEKKQKRRVAKRPRVVDNQPMFDQDLAGSSAKSPRLSMFVDNSDDLKFVGTSKVSAKKRSRPVLGGETYVVSFESLPKLPLSEAIKSSFASGNVNYEGLDQRQKDLWSSKDWINESDFLQLMGTFGLSEDYYDIIPHNSYTHQLEFTVKREIGSHLCQNLSGIISKGVIQALGTLSREDFTKDNIMSILSKEVLDGTKCQFYVDKIKQCFNRGKDFLDMYNNPSNKDVCHTLVCLSMSHWVSLSFMVNDDYSIDVIYRDPFGHKPNMSVDSQLRENGVANIYCSNDRQQRDGHNCGRYAALNTEQLIRQVSSKSDFKDVISQAMSHRPSEVTETLESNPLKKMKKENSL